MNAEIQIEAAGDEGLAFVPAGSLRERRLPGLAPEGALAGLGAKFLVPGDFPFALK